MESRVDKASEGKWDINRIIDFYTQGREENTLKTYESAYRKIRVFCREKSIDLFKLTEMDTIGLLMDLSDKGAGEATVGQVLAVINLLCEVKGRESPTVSKMVGQVKKTVVKKANLGKTKKKKVPMKMKDLRVIVKEYFKEPVTKVKPEKRIFLVLMTYLLMGMRRFSDINNIKKKDLYFTEEGDVRVQVDSSKTDKKKEGFNFTMSGKIVKGFSVKKLTKWYLKGFPSMPEEGFLFPQLKGGMAVWDKCITYREARKQLTEECIKLGLNENLTMHSGRVGAATGAARQGMDRNIIKKGGNWKSNVVDTYMQVEEPGVKIGDVLLKEF